MSKQLDAVLHGMRSAMQLAPRTAYVVPQGHGPARDAKRLNSDALSVTRIAEKILRTELDQVKNR